MNFLLIYKAWMRKVTTDERFTPHHVSLYLVLFEGWNLNRFQNPITIFRPETMRSSRIKSKPTYLRCLKDLTEWGYIRYNPSFSPVMGSKVTMYKFDTADEKNTPGSWSVIAPATGVDFAPGTSAVFKPIYKTIQNNKNSIKPNNKNDYGTSNENSNFVIDGTNNTDPQGIRTGGDHRKKQTEGGRGRGGAIPESFEEVQSYFFDIKSTTAEAEKFHNHFQSNGWKVGGRSPMKDWRAAARNWVINIQKFAHGNSSQPKPGKLNTGPKNYAEPL
jgi:hypothetical protein